MFIDPQGNVIGKHEGEMSFDQFDGLISQMVAEFEKDGTLNRNPFPSTFRESEDTQLSFPGKVLSDGSSNRLFIADTNHNRIVVSSLDGDLMQIFGTGQEALIDGSAHASAFNHPQGMTLDREILYVADTENHAIRKVNLVSGTVETIAGTGKQGHNRDKRGPAISSDLCSPYDLPYYSGTVYIAMAGIHQLWSLDADKGLIGPFAGDGGEAITDGPLGSAQLAQPCGITTDGLRLYFADSETSSIRSADIDPTGNVRTIVGLDLFVFGDADGSDHNVRLQHPIGITYHDSALYITDTYNHKIKKVLPVARTAFTMFGSGASGNTDGLAPQAEFNEPSGISIANGKMYIADTNNHVIRVADIKSGEVSTLQISGL